MTRISPFFRSTLALGLTLSLFGCGGGGGNSNSGTPALTVAPSGSLGGTNIALTVTSAGGSVTLPCSSTAAITQPLTLDGTGHFDATGTVTIVLGPPSLSGTGPAPVPATFTGTTDGKTLNLTITRTDTGAMVGTYALTYGAAPVFNQLCPS